MENLIPIKSYVTIVGIDKFLKMNLQDFENNFEKHKTELSTDYEYVLSIKKGNIEKYKERKDLENLKSVTEFFFSKIPITNQKSLIKEYKKNIPHVSSDEILQELLPLNHRIEYVQFLQSYIYVLNQESKSE
tara:strand:+ start:709 stop:1104 length:396 start_codon:yes stop_codon:yes gene_type:complete